MKDQSDNPAAQAVSIIESLRTQAVTILSAALGSKELVPFAVGAEGNFPYVWENLNTTEFNPKTLQWINNNLRANTAVEEFAPGSSFTNEFLKALGNVSYSLSDMDIQILNEASANATNQQGALIRQYKSIYGLPEGKQPIDAIVKVITTEWASNPPTSLREIKNATNLSKLLGNMPPSGAPILPLLTNWLNALGGATSLQNAVSLNAGYMAAALDALQDPSLDNGALAIGDQVFPSWTVTTPISDIMNGLSAPGEPIKLSMTVVRKQEEETSVSLGGGAAFSIPIGSFFTLGIGGQARYFRDEMATATNTINVEMAYSGVTLVNYRPRAFDKSSGKGWFFLEAVREAVSMTGTDSSSYKFSPNPNIDFSKNGSFGLTEGVAIANYPSIKITITGSNAQEINQMFSQNADISMSFLGVPLATASESSYSRKTEMSADQQSVVITLSPPPNLIGGTAEDSVAWVLGVVADYPASAS